MSQINFNELSENIQNDCIRLNALRDLLQSERQALENRDLPRLKQLMEQKQQLTLELQNSHLTLHAKKSKTFLDQVIAQALPAMRTKLTQQKNDLFAILQQCHDLNQINGMITITNQRNVEAILQILRNGKPHDGSQTTLYGK